MKDERRIFCNFYFFSDQWKREMSEEEAVRLLYSHAKKDIKNVSYSAAQSIEMNGFDVDDRFSASYDNANFHSTEGAVNFGLIRDKMFTNPFVLTYISFMREGSIFKNCRENHWLELPMKHLNVFGIGEIVGQRRVRVEGRYSLESIDKRLWDRIFDTMLFVRYRQNTEIHSYSEIQKKWEEDEKRKNQEFKKGNWRKGDELFEV